LLGSFVFQRRSTLLQQAEAASIATGIEMTREKPSMTKSSRQKAGPIPAREIDVSKAEAINALLTRPIPILPMKAGDPIRPFALGLWAEIRLLLRPEFSVSMLRRATGAYLHSKRYHLAIAQPDSVRHDIDGTPIGTVSDADSLAAQEKIQSLSMHDFKSDAPRFSANPAFEGRYVPRCPSQPE
jgi:hypothetical protein